MKSAALVFVVLGVVLAQLAQASSRSEQPRLQLVDEAPLALRGIGFVPAERVVVTVVTPYAELARRTRASRLGRFVVRFDATVDACSGARRATAVGRRGSKVSMVLARPLARECAGLSVAP